MKIYSIRFFSLVMAGMAVAAPLCAETGSDDSHSAYSGQLLPPVIAAGMDVYAIEGAERAIQTWMKGGPLENDDKVTTSAAVFQEVEKYYGKYKGYRAIGQKTLSPEAKLVFVQMNFEKGPLFLRFLCYLASDKWIVAGKLAGNTDPVEVLQNIELDKSASN